MSLRQRASRSTEAVLEIEDHMRCTQFLKTQLSAALLALFLGGSFSSLRGGVVVADPSMSAAAIYAKITALQPGDTLQFHGGTYPISIYCGITVCVPSGTATLPVTLMSFPGETALFKPTSGIRVFDFENAQAFITLDGFIIDAAGVSHDGVQIQGTAHHIKVRNCEIKNFKSMGINVGPDASFVEIRSSRIHDGGSMTSHDGLNPGQFHAVYFSGKDNLVDSCTIYNITGYGVHIYNGYSGKTADRNVVRNSDIQNCGTWKFNGSSSAAGVILSSGTGNLSIGNTLKNNPYNIKIDYGAKSSISEGNRCSLSQNNVEILIGGGSSGASIKNNCVDPVKITNQGSTTVLSNNNPTACGGSVPPPPTGVDVTQTQPPVTTQPPVYQAPPPSDQPSEPSTSQVALPFLIAGVIGAALLLGSD